MVRVAATSACGSANSPSTHVSLGPSMACSMVSVRPVGEGAGARVVPVRGVLELHLQFLHLAHRHGGNELEEEQEEGSEQSQRADVDAPVHPGGRVHAPAGGEEVTVQGGDD